MAAAVGPMRRFTGSDSIMHARPPHSPLPGPPASVADALRRRLTGVDLAALEVSFALRMTAQQVDNAVSEWMAGTAGTPARFQVLAVLWASPSGGVPHKEIVKALMVTRATVSGLMAGLERDGLLHSFIDRGDRRNLIAVLTPRGRATVERAIDVDSRLMRRAYEQFSEDELRALTATLRSLRAAFIAAREKP